MARNTCALDAQGVGTGGHGPGVQGGTNRRGEGVNSNRSTPCKEPAEQD